MLHAVVAAGRCVAVTQLLRTARRPPPPGNDPRPRFQVPVESAIGPGLARPLALVFGGLPDLGLQTRRLDDGPDMRARHRLAMALGMLLAGLGVGILSAPEVGAEDPHALTQQHVNGSLHDNSSITGCTLDKVVIGIPDETTVNVQVTPDNVWDENDIMQRGAGTTLCASKAVFGWYPTVQHVHVDVMSEFKDVRGNRTTEPADQLDVTAPNAASFNYNNMSEQFYTHPANMYCAADGYNIHPAIWKKLDSDARGCMLSPSNP